MKTKILHVLIFSRKPDPLNMLIFWARCQQGLGSAIKHLLPLNFSWILGLFIFTAALPVFAQQVSIWNKTATPAILAESDTNSVELGVQFRSSVSGHITSILFYRGAGNVGTHFGSIWASEGTLLGTVEFINETVADGWQQADFDQPVPISAGQIYTASYFAPLGNYSLDQSFFANTGVANGPLELLQDGINGGNGIYLYNATSAFPTETYEASNYWVDVFFTAAGTDTDGDGVTNDIDNCPDDVNPNQEDTDNDGIGDACDQVVGVDSDGDGVLDNIDNCPVNANPFQEDADNDGIGDACDTVSGVDTDGDGVADGNDNCLANFNPNQEDANNNGIGDACDFTGGPDNDTLAALSCSNEQVAKFNGTQWLCATDEVVGNDTLSDLSCTNGDVAKFDGIQWMCEIDEVGNDTLGDLGCSAGQVAKFDGSQWICAADDNNTQAICDLYTLTGNLLPGFCPVVPVSCVDGDRYEDQGDGTVLDCATNLVWLKDANCAGLAGTVFGGLGSWNVATSAAAALSNGTCGLTDGSVAGDWRLPTTSEFCSAFSGDSLFQFHCPASAASDSLMNTNFISPAVSNTVGTGQWIEGDPFVRVQSNGYWTATVSDFLFAWDVRLDNGNVGLKNRNLVGRVWPVRSGQ